MRMNIFAKIGGTLDAIRDYWKYTGLPKDFMPLSVNTNDLTPSFLPYTYKSLIDMSNTIPEVNAIIAYISQVVSRVPWVLEDKNGKIIEKHPFIDLLKNPNENYSYELFQQNTCFNFFTLGNVFLNFSKPVGFSEIKRIYNVPAQYMKVWTNQTDNEGNLYKDIDFRSVQLTGYKFKDTDTSKTIIEFLPDEIVHFKDTNINFDKGQWLYGQSRLYSAIMAITSLKSIYEAKVSAYQKHGAISLISPQNPMASISPEEKMRWENNFTGNYGLTGNKSPFYYASAPVNVNTIGIDIARLQLTQMSQHDFGVLCSVLGGFPSRLLNDNRASTYNNMNEDKKSLYTNIVCPYLYSFFSTVNSQKEIAGSGLKFRSVFDDIEELQKDKKIQADTYKAWFDFADSMYQKGYISKNEVFELMEMETKDGEEFNKLKEDGKETNAGRSEETSEGNGEETE